MEKIQSTTLTMKIGYCLIKAPFNNDISYLNGNLDYTPPNHKLVIFLILWPELQAGPPAKSNFLYPSIMVEPAVLITLLRLPIANKFDNNFSNKNL